MKAARHVLALALGLAGAGAAEAQLGDLLKSLAPTSAGVVKQMDDAASAPPGGSSATKRDVEAELAPDRQCNRPQEKFNILEKLLEYGGTEAQLRLQRLIESDLEFDKLSPEDKAMLRYLAKTTIWVPVWLEDKLGAAFDLAGGRKSDMTPIEEEGFAQVVKRSERFKALAADFPGDIKLSLNPDLQDGAFAKFGGRILLSHAMLQLMEENPAGADFLLAHEMSHVYKRHDLKSLQFQLISSKDGWSVAKKVLARAQRGASFDPLRDTFMLVTTVPALVKMVRGMQQTFTNEQELEADACAVLWLRGTGDDPAKGWAEYRGKFAQSSAENSYGATHPPTEVRDGNVQQRVRATAPPAPPAPPAASPTPRGRRDAPPRAAPAPRPRASGS